MKKIFTILICLIVFKSNGTEKTNMIIESFDSITIKEQPKSVQMEYYLTKYCKKYDIPKNIAYGIAYYETTYRGIYDINYKPSKISNSNALGAMQIKITTASWFMKRKISKNELLHNLELNVKISLKYLSYLKNRFGTWKKALGYYNSGYPKVTTYSLKIFNFNPNKYFINYE